MQFTIFTIAALLSLTSAAAIEQRQDSVCGSLQTAECCSTDVLGVADLDCTNAGAVTNITDFESVCAAQGKSAECCLLPVGGEALVCSSP